MQIPEVWEHADSVPAADLLWLLSLILVISQFKIIKGFEDQRRNKGRKLNEY